MSLIYKIELAAPFTSGGGGGGEKETDAVCKKLN